MRVSGFWLRVSGFWLRVSGFWMRVSGFGLRVFLRRLKFVVWRGERVFSLRVCVCFWRKIIIITII